MKARPIPMQSAVLRASVTADSATTEGEACTILVDGADTSCTANGLTGYTPTPGDRLLVQRVGGVIEVIQFLNRGTVPTAGGASVYYQDSEPTGASLHSGDIWYDTSDDNHPYVYDGTAWQDARDGTIAAAQTAADDAATAASTAQSAADAAQSTADTATTNAATAQSAADAAQTAADGAASDAADAAGIADGKADVLIQSTTPASSYEADTTLWIDTTDSANTPKKWNSTTSTWDAVTDKAATDAADAAADAQTAADAAQTAADAAQSTADTATTNAATAQSAADAAQADATSALANAATAQTTADGKSTVTYSTADASGTPGDGDVWFKFDSGVVVAQWVGDSGSWVSATIDSAVIANLDVAKLTSGNISADVISTVSDADTALASPTGLTGTLASGGALTDYVQYFYVVTTVDSSGNESLPSNEFTYPTKAGFESFDLTWNRTTGAHQYHIYRGTESGGETDLIAEPLDSAFSGTTGSYTDTGTTDSTQTPPGARLVLNGDGLKAYHASGTTSFSVDSTTGDVTASKVTLDAGVPGEALTVGHDNTFGGMALDFTGPTSLSDDTPTPSGSIKTWTDINDNAPTGMELSGQDQIEMSVDSDTSNQLFILLSTSSVQPADVQISARGNAGDRGGIVLDSGQGVVSVTGDIVLNGTNVDTHKAYLRSPGTSTAAANMRYNPGGSQEILYISSLSRDKLEQEPLTADDVRGLLDVTPKTWFDRGEVEAQSGSTEGLRRIPGLVAEDVEQHAPTFALYDGEGNLQGVAYDRIATALIPIIREQQRHIEALKEQIAALTARVAELEQRAS